MYSKRKMYYARLSEYNFIEAIARDYLELSYSKQVWQMLDWVELARIWVEVNVNKRSHWIEGLSKTVVDENDRYQFRDLRTKAEAWLDLLGTLND